MKRYFKHIVILAFLVTAYSCTDLNLSPLSEGSSENWYHTDEEYLMSLNDLMRGSFFPIDDLLWDDDIMSRNGQVETKNGNMTSESEIVKNRWTHLYKSIARSLKVLNSLENNTTISQANKKRYRGEAYFHLGFAYAELATYWGDVILDKKGMSLKEEYQAVRSPKVDVLAYAFQCLDSAAVMLPPSYNGQQRPTSGAALGFTVRFALFHQDYQRAVTAAEAVINSGVYSLEPNYRRLFQKAWSPEIMLGFMSNKSLLVPASIDFFGDVGNFCMRNIGGYCNRGPSVQLVCSYLCTDGLPIDESPLYNPKNFWANRDPRLAYTVQPFMLKADPRYADYVWTKRHQKEYLQKPEYKDSTFQAKYPDYMIYGYEYAPGPYDAKCLRIADGEMIVNKDSKGGNEHAAYQGFMLRKYVTDEWNDYNTLARHAYNTFPYLRYAEVLLSYAEAKTELGTVTQADLDKSINLVRARAYNQTGIQYPRVMLASKERLLKIIRMERRMEFPFEGIRYRDLLRWKAAEKVLNTQELYLNRAWAGSNGWDGVDISKVSDAYKVLLKNWDEGNFPIGGIPTFDEFGLPDVDYMIEKGYQIQFYPYKFDKKKNYLWPIPASDLLINPNLKQNPNY